MWKTISLIVPVLVPSWRFFKTIEPSPRVQWALFNDGDVPFRWQEFRPRPQKVTVLQMVYRLFWNPYWNETLFVVSCAERIQNGATDHGIDEIKQRILTELEQRQIETKDKVLQFRLVSVCRAGVDIIQETHFHSDFYMIDGGVR